MVSRKVVKLPKTNSYIKVNCMVRHDGYSNNEFEIIPDVLSSESR